MSDACTREKARKAVEAGKLPNRRPDLTLGGRGVGADCTICAAPVTADEPELEIGFARNGKGSAVDSYHVHPRCFTAWELELRVHELAKAAIVR